MSTQTASHRSWLVQTRPGTARLTDVLAHAAGLEERNILDEISIISSVDGTGHAWHVEASDAAIDFIKTLAFIEHVTANTRQLSRFTAELDVPVEQTKIAVRKLKIVLEEHLLRNDVQRITRNKALISFYATRQAAEFISKIACIKIVRERGACRT